MKFVSRMRKLRVIVRPGRKEIKEVAGEQVVIVHPSVYCQFEGGMFDTERSFEEIQGRINCCSVHALKGVDQLEHMMKASPEFGAFFTEFYQASPKEIIKAKVNELNALKAEYGLSDHDLEEMAINPTHVDEASDGEEDLDNESVSGIDSDKIDMLEDGDQVVAEQVDSEGNPFKPNAVIPGSKSHVVKTMTHAELKVLFKKKTGFLPMGATQEQLIEALSKL